MNLETFFGHHQIRDNPFSAEEARLDPVFDRLVGDGSLHPDFPKVLGQPDKPSTAIVFGEKGSGKTAIRIMIEREIDQHNETADEQSRILLVAYDNLNPFIDAFLRARGQDIDKTLGKLRLADHQDAILSLAVTQLVDAVLEEDLPEGEGLALPRNARKRLRKLPRSQRASLALLASLYDQPRAGSSLERFDALRHVLGLHWRLPSRLLRDVGLALLVIALGSGVFWSLATNPPWWLIVSVIISALLGLVSTGVWVHRWMSMWRSSRSSIVDMPMLTRSSARLRQMWLSLAANDLSEQPIPSKSKVAEVSSESRYQSTAQLLDVLAALGYRGMTVLVDRVDEPTAITGQSDRMKALVWPIMDNKFLKQERVGLKLLLPLELRHQLLRESPDFFQEARLDKQNMIERLSWSGAMLYDLCGRRLSACRKDGAEPMTLMDLFEDGVTREMLVDALDQMQQPRDAFKFMYAVIQEHCRLNTEDQPNWNIARLTLESVRRDQSQRVREFHQGLAPA